MILPSTDRVSVMVNTSLPRDGRVHHGQREDNERYSFAVVIDPTTGVCREITTRFLTTTSSKTSKRTTSPGCDVSDEMNCRSFTLTGIPSGTVVADCHAPVIVTATVATSARRI